MAKFNGIKVTYYGHSAFSLESPEGKVIYVDPWLSNPSAPESKEVNKADLILITHGHSDHLGDAITIANKTGAQVVCIFEISLFLQSKGISKVQPMNKGGTFSFENIKIIMTDATHSSGIDYEGQIIPGGESAGYIISFENGFKVYHMGDTGLFGSIPMIGELYKPDLVLIPIGSLFTMGPVEAAFTLKHLKPRYAIPMHWGTFPVLTGSPDEFKKELSPELKTELVVLNPGESAE